MKIGVLTSSRADFGIYIPLLHAMQNDAFFDLHIIAFGTHLSHKHGYTLNEVEDEGFRQIHKLETIPNGDSPKDIADGMGKTLSTFSKFWASHSFDLVFALGDRYEMFAAVSAASPFGIDIAHLHAGETTLGAIDNAYRHAISLFSKSLFVSTAQYAERAKEIVAGEAKIYNVGALSVDNLSQVDFLSKADFIARYHIDLELPTILSTFHPETIALEKNKQYIEEFIAALEELRAEYQIVITLPNADTMGNTIREAIFKSFQDDARVHLVESFGMLGYLSCMKHCAFLLGNTSSGFVEASYFPKYVINLGDRQKGRLVTNNIINCSINKNQILKAVQQIKASPTLKNTFPYGKGDTALQIVDLLKKKNEH